MEERALRIKLLVSYYFQNDLLQQLTLRTLKDSKRSCMALQLKGKLRFSTLIVFSLQLVYYANTLKSK